MPNRPPVLTLKEALSRARRLGASVASVHRTGEVRVTHGSTRLTINARRKDAPMTLTKLLSQLDAAAPEKPVERPKSETRAAAPNATQQPAAPILERPVTLGERVRAHLRGMPADADGWLVWGGSRPIAEELGIRPLQVSTFVSDAIRRGEIEARSTGTGNGARYDAIRFIAGYLLGGAKAKPPRIGGVVLDRPGQPEQLPIDYRDQPLRPVGPDPLSGPLKRTDEPVTGQLSVPTLAKYAQARRAIRDVPMTLLAPTDAEIDEILHDAYRLYWYMKSGGSIE